MDYFFGQVAIEGRLADYGLICGETLPTGPARKVIDGIEITCMDVAMPVMIARGDEMVPASVLAHPVKQEFTS